MNNQQFNYGNFIGKAKLYSKYRPNYSANYYQFLESNLNVNSNSIVADIGAGTGIHTKELSRIAKKIYAVEPNPQMLNECMFQLEKYSNVIGINSSAEAIELPDDSVDYITVAQAFHLFDRKKCLSEFYRIIRPNGLLILVWNSKEQNDLFFENEKVIKKYCPLYIRTVHARQFLYESYKDIFIPNTYNYNYFFEDSTEYINKETFIMRTMSASYAITRENSEYYSMISELGKVFDNFSRNQLVEIPQSTVVFSGKLKIY